MMSKQITIFCEEIRVDTTSSDTNISVELANVNISSVLGNFHNEEIIKNIENIEELFLKIVEFDTEILHNYLENAGYIFSKEKMR